MKVSIVICVYNGEKTIGRAIRSVVNQHFEADELEILVVDDGSTDTTPQIIKAIANYDPRIKVIHLDKNMGLSYAKNVGVKAARGMSIIFVDHDDWLAKYAALQLFDFLQYNKDVSYVWPEYWLVDEREEVIGRSSKIEGSGVIFRKTDLEEVGLFDETLKVFEERDILRRLEKAGKKGMHIKIPLYKYTQRPNSLSKRGLTEKETLKDLHRMSEKAEADKRAETPRVDN